jgi:hypothetical protein
MSWRREGGERRRRQRRRMLLCPDPKLRLAGGPQHQPPPLRPPPLPTRQALWFDPDYVPEELPPGQQAPPLAAPALQLPAELRQVLAAPQPAGLQAAARFQSGESVGGHLPPPATPAATCHTCLHLPHRTCTCTCLLGRGHSRELALSAPAARRRCAGGRHRRDPGQHRARRRRAGVPRGRCGWGRGPAGGGGVGSKKAGGRPRRTASSWAASLPALICARLGRGPVCGWGVQRRRAGAWRALRAGAVWRRRQADCG